MIAEVSPEALVLVKDGFAVVQLHYMEGGTEFVAGPDDAGRRLDRVLRRLLGGAGLSQVYSGLRKGSIRVNGRRAGPDHRLEEGDRILVAASLLAGSPGLGGGARDVKPGPGDHPSIDVAADRLESLMVARSEDLLVLNKPKGTLTHGPGSLDELVERALPGLGAASLAFKPGPLHRLDRNTSGLVAFPLTIHGARDFTAALREGRMGKTYLALVEARLEDEEYWEDLVERDEETLATKVTLTGKPARSLVRPVLLADGLSLVSVRIGTGRTHQIRVQCAHHGHPLAGDRKYGARPSSEGYFLHAWLLDLRAARLPGLPPIVEAPLPAESRARLERLFGVSELALALSRGRECVE